jgi:hypothetical protein
MVLTGTPLHVGFLLPFLSFLGGVFGSSSLFGLHPCVSVLGLGLVPPGVPWRGGGGRGVFDSRPTLMMVLLSASAPV